MYARGDPTEVVGTELVAARTDHRPENGGCHRLGERAERRIDHTIGQPAPAAMHDRELALGPDQHDRRTVTDPAAEHRIGNVGDDDVADGAVVLAGFGHAHEDGSMLLIRHRPRKIDEGTPTCLDLGERTRGAMEVAVIADGAADRHPVAAQRRTT